DGDVDKVLLTLQEMKFVTARAVVRNLTSKQRYELVENINSHHYKRFRTEVFECYAALEPAQVKKFDEDLLTGIDLHELTDEEHYAALHVLENLKPDDLAKLLRSRQGPQVRVIQANKPELLQTENDLLNKAGDEEEKLKAQEDADNQRFKDDP